MTPRYWMLAFFLVIAIAGFAGAAVPGANFSANTTSGDAPLVVNFTQDSTGSPTGSAWFFGNESYDQVWTLQNETTPWTRVNSITELPNGHIIAITQAAAYNQSRVYKSEDVGATWSLVNSSPGWWYSNRGPMAMVSFSDGSLMVQEFKDASGADVWGSTDEGSTWTIKNNTFHDSYSYKKYYNGMVVLSDDTVVLMGGDDDHPGMSHSNDTISSSDKGATWTIVNASSGWAPRNQFAASVLQDDTIIISGGYAWTWEENNHDANDVWASTDKGVTWTNITGTSTFTPRAQFGMVTNPDNSLLVWGGWTSPDDQDMWRSTDGGSNWVQVNASSQFSYQDEDSYTTLRDGRILSYIDDEDQVWIFDPVSSTGTSPEYTYNYNGTYSVALQSYNDDGKDVERKDLYIEVGDQPLSPPVAAFSASDTTVCTVDTVTFTDTSTGSPTSWLWDFGDGNSSVLQNPTKNYNITGSYSVNLTATNADGSDFEYKNNYIVVSECAIPETTYNLSGYVNDAETSAGIWLANVSLIQNGSAGNNLTTSTGFYRISNLSGLSQIALNVTNSTRTRYYAIITPVSASIDINLNFTLLSTSPAYTGNGTMGVTRKGAFSSESIITRGFGEPLQGALINVTNITTGEYYWNVTNNAGYYICDEGSDCHIMMGRSYNIQGTKSGYNDSPVYSVVIV